MIEKCRGLCWWAFLTALLYVAAIIFVLFCDTRGESYQPPPAPSMWGYLKSWIKSAAFYRLLLQLLQFTCTLVHTIVTHIWSWVPPLSKPRGPPDPDNIRGHRARIRYKEALMYHSNIGRPKSGRKSRLMAAALTLMKVKQAGALHHPDVLQLTQIIAPPPPPTLTQEYVDCFSMVINATEAEDHPDKQQPPACSLWDSDSKAIGVDSRCSACLTDDINDVVPGTLQLTNKKVKVYGGIFHGKVYSCTLQWTILDRHGRTHTFTLPNSYYIPEGGIKLLSPQHWAQQLMKQRKRTAATAPRVTTTANRMTMQWDNTTIELDLDKQSNVANLPQAPGYSRFKLFLQQAEVEDEDINPLVMETNVITDDEQSLDEQHPDETDWNQGWDTDEPEGAEGATEVADLPRQINFNLTPGDEASSETMVIQPNEEHQIENTAAELLRVHHQFNHIGFGKLQMMAKSGVLPKKFANCQVPICSSCMYGKATRRPWRDKPKLEQSINTTQIKYSGQCVSVDMLKSPTPGLVAQMAGWITGKRYNYATVFVDHFSRLGYVHLQKTQSAKETLEGKALFERKCAAFGIKVEHYHADNGVFAANEWKNACAILHQGCSYSGVNAHFQSGVAERRIRELQELSRTMLLHANARWPEAVNSHLWPYAMRLACEAYNEAPTKALKRSPVEIFTKTAVMPEPKHWRPFGCPVYVLDNALQNAGGIHHKWKERARVGIYLGRSPFHARSVALVMNINTGRVSPQFHVQFDPGFQTVKKAFGGRSPPILWQAICGFTKATPEAKQQREPTTNRERVKFTLEPTEEQLARAADQSSKPEDIPNQEVAQPSNATDEQPLRRSSRVSKPVIGNRLVDALQVQVLEATVPEGQSELTDENAPAPGELFAFSTLFPLHDEEDVDPIHAYAASADPDTLYHHEAMREPDAIEFKKAMVKEFQDQWDNGNFALKRRSEIPTDARVLPSVWAMKRKRKVLTGEVYKHKARLNLDGSKQMEGIDYHHTYSPTASWPAVRLMLALTLVNQWFTRQIDFVQAFPQAPMTKQQFMKLPKGIQIEGVDDPNEWVLELKRNLYGGCDAGRNWYLFLKEKLESIGFVRSRFDECVFYRGKCMYVLYTDDSILAGPDEQELEDIIKEIEGTGLDITNEGTIADFLGVHIERKDNSFHLTQPKLIESILQDLHLPEGASTKDIPMASSKLLSRHKDSADFDHHFNYRRVVGKLNFLEQSTRGDISYATHMLARFSTCPKVEHGLAAKWLGRYLLGTKDKGIILTPDPTKGMEVYCDADFAGAWDPKLAGEDIDTARSRHGYIITYAGIPLLWKSQMQGEIALSSTESEVIGLSAGLRTAIPLQHVLNEMKALGFDILPEGPTIVCKAFEDNNGALAIAKVPRMRPRTKHINNKYFHFVEYTSREDAPFSFERIDTKEQPADVLTKPLALDLLVKHRKWLLGW